MKHAAIAAIAAIITILAADEARRLLIWLVERDLARHTILL